MNPDALMAMLERSLQVDCLNADSTRAWLRPKWVELPFTTIGQSTDHRVLFRTADGRRFTIEKGQGYILRSGIRRHEQSTGSEAGMFHWSHYRFTLLGGLDLFDFLAVPWVLPAPVADQVARLNQDMAGLMKDQQSPIVLRAMRKRVICSQMLSLIVSLARPGDNAGHDLTRLVRLLPALRLMNAELARPIQRDQLAASCHLSASRFHDLFAQATGRSPLAYLTQLRLQRARQLLLTTDRPINQIALDVGFGDPFHFSRTFSRHVEMSPRDYRRQGRQMMVDAQ